MIFEVVGEIDQVETIAINFSIRERAGLKAKYGGKRWRKRKGVAYVQLIDGRVRFAEIHWYESHGIGRRRMKIKRFLD